MAKAGVVVVAAATRRSPEVVAIIKLWDIQAVDNKVTKLS